MADTRTLADLKARIQDELARGDDLTAGQLTNAIRDAVLHYQRERFYANQGEATVATIAGQAYVDPPADLVELDRLTVTANNSRFSLARAPYSELVDNWYGNSLNPPRGIPTGFAWYNGRVYLGAVPGAVYTLTFDYLKEIPEPTADGDSNFWTTDAEALIRHRAKFLLNMAVIRYQEAAAIDRELELQALANLKRETDAKTSDGVLASWG